jgi:hypothetical protein
VSRIAEIDHALLWQYLFNRVRNGQSADAAVEDPYRLLFAQSCHSINSVRSLKNLYDMSDPGVGNKKKGSRYTLIPAAHGLFG